MRGWEEVILRLKQRSALKRACKAKKPAGSLPPLETVSAGFSEASCHFYWSQHYGYLGGDQFLLVARA